MAITKSQVKENDRIVGWSPEAKRYVRGTVWKCNAKSCQIRDNSWELHTGLDYKNCWTIEDFQTAKPNEYAQLFPASEPLPKSEDVFSEEFLEGVIAELDPNCQNLTDALKQLGFKPSPYTAQEEREIGDFQEEYRGWEIYFCIPNGGITACLILRDDQAFQLIVGDSPKNWEFHFDYLDAEGILAHAKKAINAAEEFLCRELSLFESAPDAAGLVPASSLQPLASALNSSNSSSGMNSVSQSLNLDILESPSTETSEPTEQSQTIPVFGASRHPANLSASRESDLEQATQGIVSLMSSESSESHSLPTSQLKMSQDSLPAPGSQDTEAEPTSTIFSVTYGESGTTWSGSPLAAPTLERPGLESGYLLLESPSALGTRGEGPEAGQHKLDKQLKEFGAIADGEVTAPVLIEDGSGLPIGYSDPAICTTAGEFLAEMGLSGHVEKPLEMPSIGELPELRLSESPTSTASWKIITLHQPWAWAVGRGKEFETRSWSTSYRGKLLIHAAAESNPDQKAHMMWAEEKNLLPPTEELSFGAVVAVADLVDCLFIASKEVIAQQTETEQLFGFWEVAHYAWKLENIQILDKPIPCKGKQGLRDADPEILDLVQKALEEQGGHCPPYQNEDEGKEVEPGYRWIDPKDVDIESGTQIRAWEDSEKISEYAELMREDGWDWENKSGKHPQPIVFWDEEAKKYWGGDCHHRVKAAIKAEIDLIYVEIRCGSFKEAVLHNLTTNVEHGVPLRPRDQRKRIEMLLTQLTSMTADERIALLDKVPLLTDKERSLVVNSNGEWSARVIARYLRLAGGGYATVCNILKELKFKQRIEEWGIKQGARYEYKPDGSCGMVYEINVPKQRISVYWDMQWWKSRSAISSLMPLEEFLKNFTRTSRLSNEERTETTKTITPEKDTEPSDSTPDLEQELQQQDKRPQLLPDKPRNEGSGTAVTQEDGTQSNTAELLLNQLLGQMGLLDDEQLKTLIIKAKAEQERRKQIRKAA